MSLMLEFSMGNVMLIQHAPVATIMGNLTELTFFLEGGGGGIDR